MDLMKIFQALENLIFEIFANLAFWPKTLFMVLRHPVKTIRLMDTELVREEDFRFNKIMSPLFFAFLPMITLCFIFQLITPEFTPADVMSWGNKSKKISIAELDKKIKAFEKREREKQIPQAMTGSLSITKEYTVVADSLEKSSLRVDPVKSSILPLSWSDIFPIQLIDYAKIKLAVREKREKDTKITAENLEAQKAKLDRMKRYNEIQKKDYFPLITGLFFLFSPFLLAVMLILLLKEPFDKENLYKKFLHQCLLITPLNVFFYFPVSAGSGGSQLFPLLSAYVTYPVFCFGVLMLIWYWLAEVWYISHYLKKSVIFGGILIFLAYILNIFIFSYVGICLTYLF